MGGAGGSLSASGTPWAPPAILQPTTPGGSGFAPLHHHDRHNSESYTAPLRPRDFAHVDTRFWAGKHYGPVLNAIELMAVGCKPHINPLIGPPGSHDDSGDQVPFLEWNMLFPPSDVHRSDEEQDLSWARGRDEPATFPRVSTMRIVCKHTLFPWILDVPAHNKDVGVTCEDVVDAISHFMRGRAEKALFDCCNPDQQRRVGESYYHNRSRSRDVPGGSMGEGMRRVDWLCDETQFGGLEIDDEFLKHRFTIGTKRPLPCTFVLHCLDRRRTTNDRLNVDSDEEEDRPRSRNSRR